MKFARKVWKLLVAVKDALALLFLLLFFGMIYAALAARPMPGRVTTGALLLDLDGTVVEEKSEVDPLDLLTSPRGGAHEFAARDIERALRLAATDDRVKVVVLDLSRFMGGRFVHLHDIGAAMDAVRKAGKPVLTFANIYADDGVQLAAHASEAWVDPMGGAFVAGPGGNMQYFKGLFDRFKVNAHVYRVGTYKSYVEPYLRSGMSDEAREDYQNIYNALWDAYRADIAATRPKAQLERMTADPVAYARSVNGDFAQGAKAIGLVDRLGDRTEFEQRVVALVGKTTSEGDIPYAHTSLATWLKANPEKSAGAAIGVVTVAGEIVDGDAGPGAAGGDRIARLLDDNIDEGFKALVVRVDSPGGSAMAAERIRRAIDRYRARKIPVIVSMGNFAASGGYWVTTPAERIFAEPATVTGSIGVFAVVTSFEKTLADFGVTSDGVRTTPLSGQPDILGGFTPAVDTMLQSSVDSIYGRFIALVGKARGKSAEQVDAIAQGRVWPGREARRIGLVDEIGDFDAALAYAAREGGLGNKPYHAVYLSEAPDAFTTLLRDLSQPAEEELAATADYPGLVAMRQKQQARAVADKVQSLFATQGIQAYCMACAMEPGPAAPRPRREDAGLFEWLARLAGLG